MAVSRAHAEWAAERVALLLGHVTGPDEALAMSALDALDDFWPDLRTAVHHAVAIGDVELAVRLVRNFDAESVFRERDEVATWVELLVQLDGFSGVAGARDVLGVGAYLDWRAGRYDHMNHKIEQGTRLGGADPPSGVLEMVSTNVPALRGDVAGSVRIAETWLATLANRRDDDFVRGYAKNVTAMLHCWVGRSQQALSILDTSPTLWNPTLQAMHRWYRATALLDIDPAASIVAGRDAVAYAGSVRTTWIADVAANYLGAALAEAGEPMEAIEAMRLVLDHAAVRGAVQSLANTVRNGIALLARLDREGSVAVLGGWLDSQTTAIPGTAGMRRRAADVIAAVACSMDETSYRVARERGAAMSAEALVAFLRAELDELAVAIDRQARP